MSNLIRLHKVNEISREEWLDLRRRGLGGSDAATILGLNPWSSRLALYADKKGLLPEKEDNEQMRQGRDLEDYVAKRWEEATGKKARRENHMLYNDQYPWAYANIDRAVVGEKAVLECKTTSVYNKTDFAGGEIPPQYYTQCVHYMAVTGYQTAYLAVLVLNKGFYTFEIPRNQGEIDALMDAEQRFWEEHVVPGIPPEPDGSDSAQAVLDSMDRGDGTALIMDMEITFEQLQRVSEEIKYLQDEKDTLRQTIIAQLGDNNRGQAMSWKCSYLPQTRNSVDSAKLRQFYPEAYAQCVKTSSYPVFRAKKMKEDK